MCTGEEDSERRWDDDGGDEAMKHSFPSEEDGKEVCEQLSHREHDQAKRTRIRINGKQIQLLIF